MRKLLVRLFNLIYIAAAGVSIYFLATRPIIQTTAKINLTGEQVGTLLEPLLNTSGSGSTDRAITRAESGEESSGGDFTSYLTPEKIANAFKDGVKTDITIKVDAQRAYNFQNKEVIKEVVTDNLYAVLDGLLDITVPPLRSLILDVAGDFAKDALKDAINEQLQHFLGEESTVSNEQVAEIFDNIFDLLDSDGGVAVSDLTDVILNGKEKEDGTHSTGALEILNETPRYVLADPQPTSQAEIEGAAEGEEYYYKNDENKYVVATTWEDGVSYYVVKPYTTEDINQAQIEEVMTNALEEVPGLVTKNYVLVEKDETLEAKVKADIKSEIYFVETSEPGVYDYAKAWDSGASYYESKYIEIEASEIPDVQANPAYYFYIKEGQYVAATEYVEGTTYYKFYKYYPVTPTEEEVTSSIKSLTYFWKVDEENYVNVTSWDPDKDYYIYEVKVNDIDTALTYLINQYYLKKDGEEGGGSRAIVREGETLTSAKSEAELREAVKAFILSKIPLDSIVALDARFGQYVPYVLLGIIILFCLPWGWFALVSLIRTFRKNKCWTRPGIIIFGAFIQLILGIVLTYGIKYAIPLIANVVPQIQPYIGMFEIDLRFGCLIASFIYLGVFAASIAYWIIAHRVKVEYRFEKQLDRYYNSRRRYRDR